MDEPLTTQIRTALAGDQEAFEALIDRYSRLVFAQAVSLLKQPEEAEDIVQDTFIKAYRYRKMLDDPAKFPQWLLAISRNLARDRLRRRKRVVPMGDEYGEPTAPACWRPSWHLERRDLAHCIEEALHLLPERQRLVLTMKYIDGLDYHTIQRDMGITNGALRGLLGRARETLRTLLKPLRDQEL